MFVVLYDPLRLLNREQIAAWYLKKFGRSPQSVYVPGDFGADWAWWHVGFISPAEGETLPKLPTPPGENPYRDPANDESSPLFQEILSTPRVFRAFLPLVTGGRAAARRKNGPATGSLMR